MKKEYTFPERDTDTNIKQLNKLGKVNGAELVNENDIDENGESGDNLYNSGGSAGHKNL